MRTRTVLAAMVTIALVVATAATAAEGGRRGGGQRGAQGPGGPGGPGGFGGFMGGGMGGGGGVGMLLMNDAVWTEIEGTDQQREDVKKMFAELRPQRDENRPNFRDMSEEERTKAMEDMRKRGEEQAKVVRQKIGEILLPHQVERLDQIAVQVQGVNALNNPEVAAKLAVTEEQKKKFGEIRDANMAQMREMFQGGNREGAREKMEAFRKETDGKMLGVLTDEQRKKFEEMKGKPFEMPRGPFGGGRGPGGDRGPGNRGNRTN